MIGTNVNTMDDQMIFEKLLQLHNFTIFYNRQNIVKLLCVSTFPLNFLAFFFEPQKYQIFCNKSKIQ